EFKQIIGRGTRVRDDYGKLYFNILDYTGSANTLFADPTFDGDPVVVLEEETDEEGKTIRRALIEQHEDVPENGTATIGDESEGDHRKFYFDRGSVEIVAHLVYELDPDGKQLRVVKFTEYTAERVRTLFPSAAGLRSQWADPEQRKLIIASLEERGISFDELAAAAGHPEADPFDLLCHVAFNAPLRTRRERADRLRKEQTDFFERYGPEAKAVLSDLLDKYTEYGTAQFILPDALKVPPISERGNVREIATYFGGGEQLRQAVNQLQTLLYAA
ncbi:MAG: hypothetical protein JO214_16000, partial [Frankiaceae bacterium]|nr:hypothetical protein [Frankiaceae bacterium]